MFAVLLAMVSGGNLLAENPGFEVANSANDGPKGYVLSGGAKWFRAGYDDEYTSTGVAFNSKESAQAVVSQRVAVDPAQGKWLRFTFRALAEADFTVPESGLWMKMEFASGSSSRDSAERLIYREIESDRKIFASNGNYGKNGGEVWRTYELEELIPFDDVDSVQISVGMKEGTGRQVQGSYLFIDDFQLEQRTASWTGKQAPQAQEHPASLQTTENLTPLGGRWFYLSRPGESTRRVIVTEENSDRLFYQSHRLINPFRGNMTSWLKPGHLNTNGQKVTKEKLIPDSVTLTFEGDGYMKVTTHNIPNHPTAKFPDTYGTQGYNPNSIQEIVRTYKLALDPKPNIRATSYDDDQNALPMGAVGVAVNGVVFYNPFDAGRMDASNIMDRCCGHPSPDNRYHYHKYPICINTSFVDKGQEHSPVIGFAFDGFPIYGPYESAGIMAKDSTINKLNGFNAHFDETRGWHYHVSPGRFPHLLGGFFGIVESSNFDGPPGRRT